MRKVFGILMICVSLMTTVYAIDAKHETKDPQTECMLVNGDGWNSFNKSEKEIYLRGLIDLVSSCSTVGVIFDDFGMDKETISFIESLSGLIPQDFPVQDAVKEITAFYSNKDNTILPVIVAYFTIVVRERGMAEEDQLAKSTEKLVKYYKGEYVPEKSGEAETASEPAVENTSEGLSQETPKEEPKTEQQAKPAAEKQPDYNLTEKEVKKIVTVERESPMDIKKDN